MVVSVMDPDEVYGSKRKNYNKPIKPRFKGTCPVCGKEWKSNRPGQVTCGGECSFAYHDEYLVHQRYEKYGKVREFKYSGECIFCGKEWKSNRKRQRTCGEPECQKKLAQETLRKRLNATK